MAERMISLRDVIDRTSLSKTQIYRLIAAGTFPRPVPLGPGRVAFIESDVAAWVDDRVAARDAGEGVRSRAEAGRRAQAASHQERRT